MTSRWWVLDATQSLIDEGLLSERHVLLQALEALVGTVSGFWHPDHIPWSEPPQSEVQWRIRPPALSGFSSWMESLNHHGNGKTDTLLRGQSFTQAKGDTRLINMIAPSAKKIQDPRGQACTTL